MKPGEWGVSDEELSNGKGTMYRTEKIIAIRIAE